MYKQRHPQAKPLLSRNCRVSWDHTKGAAKGEGSPKIPGFSDPVPIVLPHENCHKIKLALGSFEQTIANPYLQMVFACCPCRCPAAIGT